MSAKRAVHRRVPRRPKSNRLETARNWAVIVGVAVTVGVELFRASGWFDARLGELRTRIDEVQQALDGRITVTTQVLSWVGAVGAATAIVGGRLAGTLFLLAFTTRIARPPAAERPPAPESAGAASIGG